MPDGSGHTYTPCNSHIHIQVTGQQRDLLARGFAGNRANTPDGKLHPILMAMPVCAECGAPQGPDNEWCKWVPRGGQGHAHPGGDGSSFEMHRVRLEAEGDPDPRVGEPLLRNMTETRNEARFRSSIWASEHDAAGCLETKADRRFCSRKGSFACGVAVNGFGEWIVFDLQQEQSIAKMRLVNYWSSSDSYGFKDLVIEIASELDGPFAEVAAYSNLPRCAASKAVDLYMNGSGRFWRVRCTANHGGSAFGIYGVDFWLSSDTVGGRAMPVCAECGAPQGPDNEFCHKCDG